MSALNYGASLTAQPAEIVVHLGQLLAFDATRPVMLSFFSASMTIGGLVGCSVLPLYADRLGHTQTLIMMFSLQIVFNMLYMVPIHWAYTLFIRLIQGLMACTILSLTPLLVGAHLDEQQRSVNMTWFSVCVNTGIWVSYLVHLCVSFNYEYWQCMVLQSVFFSAVGLAACSIIYVGLKQRTVVELVSSIESTKVLLTQRQKVRLIYIAVSIGAMQVFTGMDAVFIYSSKILAAAFTGPQAGIYGAIIYGACNVATNMLAIPIIRRVRRKLLMYVCTIGIFVSHLTVGLLYLFKVPQYFILALLIVFLCFLNVGPQPLMLILFSELFPAEVRTRYSSLGYTFNWIANIIVIFVFDFFSSGNEQYVYWLFGTLTLILGVSGCYLMPETHNAKPEDIEAEIQRWGTTGRHAPSRQELTS